MRVLAGHGCKLVARALGAALLIAVAGPAAHAVDITLTPFASGLTLPVTIANAGDSRLFVVEKGGTIRVVQSDGTVLGTPFLDISSLVSPSATNQFSEQGLLGLAFHPNYASNGFFYVNYTDGAGDTQVVRYTVSMNPDVADSLSATPVLSQAQPFANHNGGGLIFGPDGFLYISLGDGGSGCDPGDRAQDLTTKLGKLLRIDVDSGSPYAIPPSNPFAGSMTAAEEIWDLGLRNPWRFSFDRSTGDMFIADVGQSNFEEVDFEPAGGSGGVNYGWDCFEGNGSPEDPPSSCPMTTATCTPTSMFTFPVHEYDHNPDRCSITGGFIYRGTQSPTLNGQYFFADFCSSDIYSLATPDNGMTWNLTTFGQVVPGLRPTTFGEDSSGEIYVAGFDNNIYHIEEAVVMPPAGCPTTPAGGCLSPGKASINLKQPGDASKNKLIWKWLKGPALGQTDFGDPTGTTSYNLCVYAGTSNADLAIDIPGGSNWQAVSDKGYKFKDTNAGGDGISKVLAKGGADGKSKIIVKGKGANLDLSALPLNPGTQLTVQLIRSDDPACWESVFPVANVDADDATTFKAKLP